MKIQLKTQLIAITSLLIIGCTWVNENPESQSVAITTSEISCPKVGTISVSTKDKVTFVKRGDKKVLSELQALARNEALKINANTIKPDSEITEGKQRYIAYKCPR